MQKKRKNFKKAKILVVHEWVCEWRTTPSYREAELLK